MFDASQQIPSWRSPDLAACRWRRIFAQVKLVTDQITDRIAEMVAQRGDGFPMANHHGLV